MYVLETRPLEQEGDAPDVTVMLPTLDGHGRQPLDYDDWRTETKLFHKNVSLNFIIITFLCKMNQFNLQKGTLISHHFDESRASVSSISSYATSAIESSRSFDNWLNPPIEVPLFKTI